MEITKGVGIGAKMKDYKIYYLSRMHQVTNRKKKEHAQPNQRKC